MFLQTVTIFITIVLILCILMALSGAFNEEDEEKDSETLAEENEKLKEENEKLANEVEHMKSQIEHMSGLLSAEQMARFSAEEKAKAEEEQRREAEEKAKEEEQQRRIQKEIQKRTLEALEVESQMAVIVAQEKAKKERMKLLKQAELEKQQLQEQAELEKQKLQEEREEEKKRLQEQAELEKQKLQEEREEEKKRLQEQAELEKHKLQEDSEAEKKRLQEQAELEKRRIQEEGERKLEEEKRKWTNVVSSTSKTIADLSFGKIRAINHLDLDTLIIVHGKKRPIAVYVKTCADQLSYNGAFIYDTHKCRDNALYLFVGSECPKALEGLGEKLLDQYMREYPDAEVIRVMRTTESPEFKRMIKAIGGHISQIQPSTKAGDEFFFENNFFKVKLHLIIYSNGEVQTPEVDKQLKLDDLPEKGAAIVDTSDKALYLYIPHADPIDDQEKEDQEKCIKYMSEERDYNGRDVTIFNSECIPPNLKVLFNIV